MVKISNLKSHIFEILLLPLLGLNNEPKLIIILFSKSERTEENFCSFTVLNIYIYTHYRHVSYPCNITLMLISNMLYEKNGYNQRF